jgi:hypothetical protein
VLGRAFDRHLRHPDMWIRECAAHFGVRLTDNNRERQDQAAKSLLQADKVAGSTHFVANEFESFQANRLGPSARLDSEPRHHS